MFKTLQGNRSGNEAPKEDNKQTKQGAQNIEGNELEQKAAELAKLTREKGMGIPFGKFPRRLLRDPSDLGFVTSTGDFIQGEAWDDPRDMSLPKMYLSTMIAEQTPIGLRQRLGMIGAGYEHIQLWIASNYEPPVEIVTERMTKEYQKKELFGFRKKTVITYKD